MMIREAVPATAARLRSAQLDEAQVLAEYLVAEVAATDRLRLPLKYAVQLTERQQQQLEEFTGRIAQHEPLQYVLGYTEFCGRRFKTDSRALIPRPETEELVQRVLDQESLWRLPQPRIIDVGTGTGCIALTLAREHPEAQVVAVEIDPATIELALENEDLLRVETVEWIMANLLNTQPEESADAIVSNPPYIASAQLAGLDRNVRDYEPCGALDGGPDGLRVIDNLIGQAHTVLRPDGWLFLEIGEDQGAAVSQRLLFTGYRKVEIGKDLAGHDRIATGCK